VTSLKRRPPQGKYIEHRARVRVRFHEVDTLQIVWHGHYLTYFEDARVELGRAHGINYSDIRNAGLAAPIVHVSCDFLASARFDEELEVVARLYERESAKIEFYYEVWRPAPPTLLATGHTVQAFAAPDGTLLLTLPQFMRDFYARCRDKMQEGHE
jgi:acyl-CoA thioester hydrolase